MLSSIINCNLIQNVVVVGVVVGFILKAVQSEKINSA